MKKKIVVLVGGTGRLGKLIASRFLDKPGVELRLLVREDSQHKAKALVERGAKVVEGSAGAGDTAMLARLMKGATTVISAVQGGEEVIVGAQRELLQAARTAGVHRFIPSDYSVNFFDLQPAESPRCDLRRQFAELAAAEKGDVEVVHVLAGEFFDARAFRILGLLDLARHVASVWGNGTQLMDFTTIEDTAAYVAEVALDDRPLPGTMFFAGEVIDFNGLVRACEQATGRHVQVERKGTLIDLAARIAELQAADPDNTSTYKTLLYLRAILNGRGKLDGRMNDRYPDIKPASAADFFARPPR